MAQIGRLLIRQGPILQNHCICAWFCASFQSSPLSLTSKTSFHRRFTSTTVVHVANSRSCRLRLPASPPHSDLQDDVADEEDDGSESESEAWKSRNQLKREARLAVRWGMDLVSFSVPQIKRILSVASLEKEVFQAIILAKKLGPDVREGKRRQYNYIGKLIRDVDPELMDTMIQATKDGDHNTLASLAASKAMAVGYNAEEDYEETDREEDEGPHVDVATRWLDGLINKNIEIMNEVYSIRDVEFDRQDLRKLVRRVHSAQEKHENAADEIKRETNAATVGATKSLTRYLRALAKQLQNDMNRALRHHGLFHVDKQQPGRQ